MNKNRNLCKLGIKISTNVMIIQLIVFVILYFTISGYAGYSLERSAVSSMQTSANDRSVIINDYIQSACDTLSSYLNTKQIKDIVSDPTSPANVTAAQKYTEEFSKAVPNLEGIYASSWETEVLTHTQIPLSLEKSPDLIRLPATSFMTRSIHRMAYITQE